MKKLLLLLSVIFMLALSMTLVSCEDDGAAVPSADITVAVGQSVRLPVFASDGGAPIEYTYESEAFVIENGMIKGVAATDTSVSVTAKTDIFERAFNVTVIDAGVMNIADVEIDVGAAKKIAVKFSEKNADYKVAYSFEGENISIDEDGKLKGIVADTVTAVTATTEYHTEVFLVKVRPASYGELIIDAPDSIYTNYPGKEVICTFTDPRFTSDVRFSANDSRVTVKDGKISAKGDFDSEKEVTVTATTEHHSTTFKIKVSEYTANFGRVEHRISAYEEEIISTATKGGMIFIGDSYFDKNFWSDFYDDWSDVNAYRMGISQSGIKDWEIISDRLVYPMKPKEIVAHIGFNDAHSSNISAYELADRLIDLFEQYREKLPGVTVYYFGIEPKKNSHVESNQFHSSSFVKAPKVNEIMKAYAEANDWFVYLDSPSFCFNPDGTVKSSFYLSTDLSHPTLDSYELYEAMLRQARSARAASAVNVSYSAEAELPVRKKTEENTSII